jgi:hypothetical protein
MHIAPISLHRLQQILLTAGVIALVNSLAMVWAFGASMSLRHAVGLVIVDIVGTLAFVMAGFMATANARGAARAAYGLGAAALTIAFFSHLGYTIGMRTESVAEATTQAAAYTMRADNVAEKRELLAVMQSQLTDLREQNAWSASVTADALRQQVVVGEEAVRQEEARRGCKSKCLDKMAKLADLKSRIATLEKQDDLSARIAATQAVIADAGEATIATKVKLSPVKAQTEFVPQLYNLMVGADAETILSPTGVQMSITGIIIGFLIALASTGSAPALFWLAFWGATEQSTPTAKPVVPQRREAPPAPAAPSSSFGFILPSAPSLLFAHGTKQA